MKKETLFSGFGLLKLFALTITFALCFGSCSKNNVGISTANQPFANLDDTTTQEIIVTIPRIELSAKKNGGIIVYVSVTDQDGNVLGEFNEHNFNLAYFCKGDPDTLSVEDIASTPIDEKRSYIAAGVTMDYSGSMSGSDIINMENAVKQFIRLKEPNEYMQIIKFASYVETMNAFTNDTSILIEAVVNQINIGNSTAYYDAIYTGLTETDAFIKTNAELLPAIIALTDGRENNSSSSLSDIIQKAEETQIPIYTLGFGNVDEPVMQQIAETTGGRYMYTPTADQVESLYRSISEQLQNIYSLSWQMITMACDELIIVVHVEYENANGLIEATATRSFFP